MKKISPQDIRDLAQVHQAHCISLYLPSHQGGMEVLNREDPAMLRQLLKEATREMVKTGMTEKEIDALLEPAASLLKEDEFWRHQENGLAIFLAEDFFRAITLPEAVGPRLYIAHNFLLLPLLPLAQREQDFYLLGLALDEVKLFRCRGSECAELPGAGILPSGLEEVVGTDYWEKSFQARNLRGGKLMAIYHGQGEGKDDSQEEIRRFLREVDKAVRSMITEDGLPLVLAAVDHIYSEYHHLQKYSGLQKEYLPGHPWSVSEKELQRRALQLLHPYFEREEKKAAETFRESLGSTRVSNQLAEIVPAAMAGRVQALFLQEGTDEYGFFDTRFNRVEMGDPEDHVSVSLFNLAAVESFLRGAAIYLVRKENMPDGFSSINALYRYA